MFAVTTPFGTDLATEVRQGRTLVDTAEGAGLGHLVLTTAAHADRGTGVPHYESKNLVERHLRASAVPWTVIAPAAFMDNYASGWTLDGLRRGTFAWPMPADRPLTLIPAVDIGAFAALVLQRSGDFAAGASTSPPTSAHPPSWPTSSPSPSVARSPTSRCPWPRSDSAPPTWRPCSTTSPPSVWTSTSPRFVATTRRSAGTASPTGPPHRTGPRCCRRSPPTRVAARMTNRD
ncbi:NmrA family NAD(P)-binding protein [Micromonospora sp. M12]